MYLNYIQRNGQVLGASEADYTFGWDNKHVGARMLLSKVLYFASFFYIYLIFLFLPVKL